MRKLARRVFRNWLRQTESVDVRREIKFEPLELRQLMASDFFLAGHAASQSNYPSGLLGSGQYSLPQGSVDRNGSTMPSMSRAGLQGEGEAQPDLVAFAKALDQAGVQFFGAAWCPFCTEQKQLFEDGGKYLPFVEVTNPDRTPNSLATQNNVTTYPTWEFPNGQRVTGLQTLAQLSSLSGVAIPMSSTPSVETIPNQQVLVGSPLHVPVDAYDPNGNPLTITVSSSNPALVTAQVLSGSRSARITTDGFGPMTFELFESEASRATSRFIQLAQSGFYNKSATNQVPFHRVINQFVIQGGDPTGTGSGGSTLGNFDDHFDVDLQHNRTGVLSYAKSSDDTNDSQFFITEGPQRFLDFNHSIFGQLVEGDAVREAISNTATNASDRPTNAVIINNVAIFDDTENGLIRLSAVGTQTGTATITVTVRDSEGNETQQNFTVTVAADNSNSSPFLADITPPTPVVGTPVDIQLSAIDVEGDPVSFSARVPSGSQYSVQVNPTTGLLTLTPNSGFTAPMQVTVEVRAASAVGTPNAPFDSQTFTVSPQTSTTAPTGVDLQAASDSGASNSDNVTNAGSLTFDVSGTVSGALVQLLRGTTVVGSATATGTTTSITTSNIATLGTGSYTLTAQQTLNGSQSQSSPALNLTFDNTAPAQIASTGIPATANVGGAVSVTLNHPEKGSGLLFGLQNNPTGMTIDASTGVLAWTPTASQLGAQSFNLLLTDAAGNQTTQAVTITVNDSAQGRIALKLVDLNNNPIQSLAVGQSFKVQVIVSDLRTPVASGVFAARLDMLYNSTLVETEGTSPITFGTDYTNGRNGSTSTAGVIDELGAISGSTSPLGEQPRLLAEIRLRTKATGSAVFTSESAESTGSEFLLYGINSAIPNNRIEFGTTTLAIGLNFNVANDSFNFNEDSSNNTLNVLDNDVVDPGSGAVLSIQAVSATSAGGTVTIAPDGRSLRYTPAANFNGGDSFTYTAANQGGATRVATVTIQVQPVNDAPNAVNDSQEVIENSSENFLSVLSNDDDGPDANETLRITTVGTPSQGGRVTIGASGNNLLYSPRSGFVGSETFTYTISDNGNLTSTATVTINVRPAVPPPTAVSDAFTVAEDAAAADFDVLANDTPSQTGETLTIVNATATSGVASVTVNGTRLNYRPNANFSGTDIVSYTLRGSQGGQTTGTVTYTVTPVNDGPTSVDDTLTANATSSNTSLDVLANDTNVDAGETLTITAVTQPASGQGTVSISSDSKRVLYTPPSNQFSGAVTFTYTIGDGSDLRSTANVALQVQAFQPRDIGAILTNSASSAGDFFQFEGISARLTGTDLTGQAVSRNLMLADGRFVAPSLPPGTYTIETPSLPFFMGSPANTVTIHSAANDTSSVSTPLNVGMLDPRYIDIRDFLGTTMGRGLLVAIAPGQNQSWIAGQGDWRDFKSISATLTPSSNQLQLQATRSNDQRVQSNINIPSNQIELRGNQSGASLLRYYPPASGTSLTNAPATNSNGNNTNSNNNSGGEGEGPSAGLVAPSAPARHSRDDRPATTDATVKNGLWTNEDAVESWLPWLADTRDAGGMGFDSDSPIEEGTSDGSLWSDEVFDAVDDLLDMA
jgi:cyclophilin family peptidyl-prolyl cis-trans isomerase